MSLLINEMIQSHTYCHQILNEMKGYLGNSILHGSWSTGIRMTSSTLYGSLQGR